MSVTETWKFSESLEQSERILDQISSKLQDGEDATDLVNSLQSIWLNRPETTVLTGTELDQLSIMLDRLNETVSIGEKWLDQATDMLGQMNRGRKMMKDYQMNGST